MATVISVHGALDPHLMLAKLIVPSQRLLLAVGLDATDVEGCLAGQGGDQLVHAQLEAGGSSVRHLVYFGQLPNKQTVSVLK